MAIFSLVDTDEDLKNTFFNFVLVPWDVCESPPTLLLHTAMMEQNFIYSTAGSVNRYHAVFPHIFFNSSLFSTSIQLLDDTQLLKKLSKPGCQPTLTICAAHFEQRLKRGKSIKENFPCASQAAST